MGSQEQSPHILDFASLSRRDDMLCLGAIRESEENGVKKEDILKMQNTCAIKLYDLVRSASSLQEVMVMLPEKFYLPNVARTSSAKLAIFFKFA
jgi:hypothetical protein